MSTSHRREVAKRLKQEIDATTDPQRIIELSNALAKFTPRPRQARRGPRKVEATKSPSKVSIIDTITGSALDELSDGKKMLFWLVKQIEKMRKEKKTKAEQDALIQELYAGLSERDRAALDALDTKSLGWLSEEQP